MAEFSKESNSDFNDFSIKEIFEGLEEDHYISQICEHFGFLAIGNIKGVCVVAMPIGDEQGSVNWHEFCFDTNTILEVPTKLS